MIKLITSFFFCSIFIASAQNVPADGEILYQLIEQRKTTFNSYANSIEKRSGIFGNKTKKDMQQSNVVLMRIVEIDNKIISVLNRTVDFRTYEKLNLGYDSQQHRERVNTLLKSVYVLQKQVEILKVEQTLEINKKKRLETILFCVTILALGLLIALIKKQKQTNIGRLKNP